MGLAADRGGGSPNAVAAAFLPDQVRSGRSHGLNRGLPIHTQADRCSLQLPLRRSHEVNNLGARAAM